MKISLESEHLKIAKSLEYSGLVKTSKYRALLFPLLISKAQVLFIPRVFLISLGFLTREILLFKFALFCSKVAIQYKRLLFLDCSSCLLIALTGCAFLYSQLWLLSGLNWNNSIRK